jgi:hypothetical protein
VIFELLLDVINLRDGVDLLIVSLLGVEVDGEGSNLPFLVNLADLFLILELVHGLGTNVVDQVLVVVQLKLEDLLESDGLKVDGFSLLTRLFDNTIPMSFLDSRVT